MDKYSFGTYQIIPGKFSTIIVEAENEDEARQKFHIEMGFTDAPIEPIPFKNFYWEKELAVTDPQLVVE